MDIGNIVVDNSADDVGYVSSSSDIPLHTADMASSAQLFTEEQAAPSSPTPSALEPSAPPPGIETGPEHFAIGSPAPRPEVEAPDGQDSEPPRRADSLAATLLGRLVGSSPTRKKPTRTPMAPYYG